MLLQVDCMDYHNFAKEVSMFFSFKKEKKKGLSDVVLFDYYQEDY